MSCVELRVFQELIQLSNPLIYGWLYTSGNSIRKLILQEHQKRRIEIIDDLHNARSKIHLSFDLWTSPNSMVLCEVVAHYLRADLTCQNVLIGMKRVAGAHSDENIAETVLQVINEYGIASRIDYLQADSVGCLCSHHFQSYLISNKPCLSSFALLASFITVPRYIEQSGTKGLNYSTVPQRLLCTALLRTLRTLDCTDRTPC